MSRSLRTAALFASGTILLSFTVLVVNQTAQVVQLATAIDPAFGTVMRWGLLTAYAALVGVPAVLVLRLPSPLVPPETDEGPEFAAHLKALAARLATSPHLCSGFDLTRREGVEAALAILDARTDAIVKDAGAAVFLSTAVSQSGRLDGLVVLLAQSRMVWNIAHVYSQRPTPRDMVNLYANVAATAFLACELQDVDLADQLEPVLASAVGTLGANVPGLHFTASILANSLLSGSANAFLTLRIGMIAKRYCGALVVEPRAQLRHAATAEAARCLQGIVADGSTRLTRAFVRASVDRVGGALSGASARARDAGARLVTWARQG